MTWTYITDGRSKKMFKNVVTKAEKRDHLKNIDADGRIVLTWI
jgi:hypothetical protein